MFEKMNASVALLIFQKTNSYPVSKPINHPYSILGKYSSENKSKSKKIMIQKKLRDKHDPLEIAESRLKCFQSNQSLLFDVGEIFLEEQVKI